MSNDAKRLPKAGFRITVRSQAVRNRYSANRAFTGNQADTHYNDPVAGYDALASRHLELRRRCAAYLDSTENTIAERIPPQSRSLLDVGAGDGTRALGLARRRAFERVVLVEPSSAMILPAGKDAVVWPARAEKLPTESATERFDVILCLWNVLGHIQTGQKRARALEAISPPLSPRGIFFLDVTPPL